MGVDQNPNTVGILHFAQESGRRDVEISTLRRQKHSLEAGLRELNQSMLMKDSTWAERCESLTEDLRRAERNRSRESANLEYLKNVVYRYMCGVAGSDGLGGRQQMLNAIATILAFSPHEKSQVQAVLTKGWWANSSKK